MWMTLSLPLLSGPLWPGMVVPVLGPSMGQTELLNHLLRIIISYLEPYSYVQIIYVI